MASENLEAVKTHARDLNTQEPRAKTEQLGGFTGGMRALDKCRASLVGQNADFIFNCPMDQRFFQAAGIEADAFQSEVARGASDEAMDRWVRENARKE